MKALFSFISGEWTILTKGFVLRYNKSKANRLHKLTGMQYHVIPTDTKKLMVVNSKFIAGYNKIVKGKGKQLSIADLLKMSVYSTPQKKSK